MADDLTAASLDFLDEDIPVIDQSGKTRVVKGSDFVDIEFTVPTPTAQGPRSVPPAPPQPKETMVTVRPEDEQEAAVAAKKAEEKGGAQEAKTAEAILADTVDLAVAASGVTFENEDLQRRFRNLLALFFRDLRDGLETKSKLTMPTASGGMGMADAEADRVMALMDAKHEEFHAATTARAEKEKQQFVQIQAQKLQQESEREQKRETVELDDRFSKLVQKSGVAPSAPAGGALPTPVAMKSGEPARLAPQMPVESLPKIIPVVSMDKKPAVPPQAAPANLPVAPVPPLRPSAPPPEYQAPSPLPPSVPAAAPEPAKPTVSDVKFTPRLTGPVEELRALTLKDFRRLSKDPSEATLKVKDKIDLLEDRGFELKTQGIKAWQDSEANRLYLDMLRKSLEGKPVTEVISEFEAKGQPVRTKAEFDAIMTLNRQLRFG